MQSAPNEPLRYAYIKNGDGVGQVKSLAALADLRSAAGPEAFIADLLQKIDGAPVLVLSRHDHQRYFTWGAIEAWVYRSEGNRLTKFYYRSQAGIKTFVKLMRFRPDRIVCGTAGVIFWFCWLAARIRRAPIVRSVHNRIERVGSGLTNRIVYAVDTWVTRHADAVVCHGPYLRQEILRLGVEPARVFDFDVSFANVDRAAARMRQTRQHQRVLFIGRIERQKGVFDLLDALQPVLLANSQAELIYVGHGAAAQALEQAIHGRGLTGQASLSGSVPANRIIEWLAGASLLVAPTRSSFPEGRCMAAMEALVAAVPLVAPDFGPFPYLVEDDINGFLYRPDSVADLRAKIEAVLGDTDLQQRLAAGAARTGDRLAEPERTFGQAVLAAFDDAGQYAPDEA